MPPLTDSLAVELPPVLTAPREAREVIRRWLGRRGLQESADDVALLVSELVTNAITYGASQPVRLALRHAGGVLRCEVTNDGSGAPAQRAVPTASVTGRGLLLVDRLASRWGAVSNDGCTTVWFEIGA